MVSNNDNFKVLPFNIVKINLISIFLWNLQLEIQNCCHTSEIGISWAGPLGGSGVSINISSHSSNLTVFHKLDFGATNKLAN